MIRKQQLVPGIPGSIVRGGSQVLVGALIHAGDLAAAESACAEFLAQCREYGDLQFLSTMLILMADLDILAGRFQDAATHLREGLQADVRDGLWFGVLNGL